MRDFVFARSVAFAAVAVIPTLSGCSPRGDRSNVIAFSNTTIGVSGGLPPGATTPDVTVGFKRQEFAMVPTNRCDSECPQGGCGDEVKGGGASDTADVLMEIQGAAGLSTLFSGQIYQRLAVGKTAVSQPGAAFLMMKGMNGEAQKSAADSMTKLLEVQEARLKLEAQQLAAVTGPSHLQVLNSAQSHFKAGKTNAASLWMALKAKYPTETAALLQSKGATKTEQDKWETKPELLVVDLFNRNPSKAPDMAKLIP